MLHSITNNLSALNKDDTQYMHFKFCQLQHKHIENKTKFHTRFSKNNDNDVKPPATGGPTDWVYITSALLHI